MFITKRPTVEALEKRIGEVISVLDHGYIILRDYMGNDESIANAARTSYQKGTKTLNDNKALIRYLVEHKHTSPLEMCEIQIEIKLPIFIARQWIRHRTANVNEMSARYSILEKEFYVPAEEHCAPQSKTNKQGRGGVLSPQDIVLARDHITKLSEQAYAEYEYLLGEDVEGNKNGGIGLARELSRMVLPTNFYTRWVWKIDLHNLLHFLRLRMDGHAQYEIRAYADAIYEIVKDWVPMVCEAFENGVLHATTFTKEEMDFLKERLPMDTITSGLNSMGSAWSERRRTEFLNKLNGK